MNQKLRSAFYVWLAAALVVTGTLTAVGSASLVTAAGFAGGDGTADNPYVIETPGDLYEWSADQSAYAGSHFRLAADIDFTGWDWITQPWTPIGNEALPFAGTFDGEGHVVRGLVINDAALASAGLFGRNTGEIRNVGVVDATVTGGSYTGALVGSNSGHVQGSYSTGIVSGANSVGGLVGANHTGGIVEHVYSTADASGDHGIGGLVGSNTSGAVVQHAFATGNVTGAMRVGGIAGLNDGASSLIQHVYATGNASGTVWDVGGIVGFIASGSLTQYVIATGEVSGPANSTGTLIGYSDSATITRGFWSNDGRTTGWYGQNYGYSSQLSGKTLAELQQEETYSGWPTFGDHWWMPEEPGLPQPRHSSSLQNVVSSIYLSDHRVLTLSGQLTSTVEGYKEPLDLHMVLLDADSNAITEAEWSPWAANADGSWQMTFDREELSPISGPLPDGSYKLRLWAEGSFQNTAVRQVDVIADTVQPDVLLEIADPAPAPAVTIDAAVNDAGSGLDVTKWAAGDRPASYFAAEGTVFTDTFDVTANGRYTVYAIDRAGNETIRTIDVTTFPPPPSDPVYLSDNADLRSLEVWSNGVLTPLTPDFQANTADYAAISTTNRVELRAAAAHPAAKVTVEGTTLGSDGRAIELVEGDNTFEIVVQAENGRRKSYRLTVTYKKPISFTDIAGHWAEPSILHAAERGLAQGFGDGTFRPDLPVTRAAFARMISNALQFEGSGALLHFADAEDIGDWAKQPVAQAAEAGVIVGYPDGYFRPDRAITRSEMAVMAARALDLPIVPGSAAGFADDEHIPSWASGAVRALREAGVLIGTGNDRFEPSAPATRAQTTVMLLRMFPE